MTAILKVSHRAIGAEVRRKPYTVEVDDKTVGSVDMNATLETSVGAGTHTLRIREGRKSSKAQTVEFVDGQTVSFRATGKRFVVLFLLSFIFPKLGLVLVPVGQ